MSRFSKWLEKKAHSVRIKRIFRKYGPSPELGHNPNDLSDEQQRKAFLEAYVETGDTRCLIDYFQLRKPQDYRYFEKAFREALVMSDKSLGLCPNSGEGPYFLKIRLILTE